MGRKFRKAILNYEEANDVTMTVNHLPFQIGPEWLADEIFFPNNTRNCPANFLTH